MCDFTDEFRKRLKTGFPEDWGKGLAGSSLEKVSKWGSGNGKQEKRKTRTWMNNRIDHQCVWAGGLQRPPCRTLSRLCYCLRLATWSSFPLSFSGSAFMWPWWFLVPPGSPSISSYRHFSKYISCTFNPIFASASWRTQMSIWGNPTCIDYITIHNYIFTSLYAITCMLPIYLQ